VILCCEELVDAQTTLSDPNRILLPEVKVAAVVHEPGGSHPAPLQGYWRRDHAAHRGYAARSRTAAGFQDWLHEWVLDVPDRAAYLRKIDTAALRITRHLPSAPIDYGDE
jgi:glutaconate CoA-transferase subunit A